MPSSSALPTIARELNAGAAELEAVVAVYLIGYATLVITGGRLGDLYGIRNTFIAGVIGDADWSLALWLVTAAGVALLALFMAFERRLAARGGQPLVPPVLLDAAPFSRGLMAVFWFFFANLSFYLVMTLFMQSALGLSPLAAGATVLPLALAFVIASRQAAGRVRSRGTAVLLEGCAVEIVGLVAVAIVVAAGPAPNLWLLIAALALSLSAAGLVAMRRAAITGSPS